MTTDKKTQTARETETTERSHEQQATSVEDLSFGGSWRDTYLRHFIFRLHFEHCHVLQCL